MKKTHFLSLMFLLLTGISRAGVYSGTVTNANTSAAVVGQIVELRDSLTGLFMVDTTDANGGFSFALPTTLPSSDDMYTRLFACSQNYSYMYTYTSASPNHTHNFQICATPYKLQGTVSLGGVANTGVADVYVISKSFDSLTNAYTLTAIDTIVTGSNGAYLKAYSSIPYGQLLVKAALRTSHPNYAGFLPTYYTSSLNWSSATTVNSSNFMNNAVTNINMIGGTNPGGPGFIGGLVSQGANRGSAVGDPLNKRILLLTNSAGQAVAYTYSDANGQFSFPALAYGTYKIFGDAMGKLNPQLTVTISAANSAVREIVFEENSTQFAGHINTLAISTVANPLTSVTVFPNPATDYLQLSGLDAISGAKTVQLCNINGASLSAQSFAHGQAARISVATLPAGIYLLQVRTEAGNAQFKVVK